MPTDQPHGDVLADTAIQTLWFGMRCASTQAAIAAARTAARTAASTGSAGGVEVVAVIVPAGPRRHTEGWPPPAFDRAVGVPVVEIVPAGDRGRWEAVSDLVQETGATVGVGACFPWKVPASVRSAFPLGVVNIHPSLLPALRGADPVGDAVRLGLRETGVTIHLMDDGWDTGPILASRAVPIESGRDVATIEEHLFGLGGEMLGVTLGGWRAGAIVPDPQEDTGGDRPPSLGP